MRKLAWLAALLPSLALATPNATGINIGAPNDFAGDRLFADIMRTARPFSVPGSDTTLVAMDANGWPLVSSFLTYIVEALDNNHGTYTLTATGRIGGVSVGGITNTVSALSYDAGTNTTTGTITISGSGSTNINLTFTGCYRDSGSTVPGLTNIRLMRPSSLGSGTSYSPGTLVATPIVDLVQKFGVVRYLDMDATNWSQVQEWAGADVPLWQASHAYSIGDKVRWGRMPATTVYQATVGGTSGTTGPTTTGTITDGGVTWAWVGESRTLPSFATYAYDGSIAGFGWEGHGVDWETIIQIANAVNRDAWINLPALATDEFITKTLQVFKCGSDGLDPWVNVDGTCKASPAYPPLASGLNLYVEYSNEVWNNSFAQASQADTLAAATPAGSPIRYDGIGATRARFTTMRAAQISLIARSVFGDAAMMTRVRPILSGQSASYGSWDGGILFMLQFVFDYMNNGAGAYVPNANWVIPGTSTQVTAHPPSYFFYGAGGAGYYGPSDESSVTALLTTGEMDPTYWITGQQWTTDVDIPPAFGLKRVAYEGGPSFDSPTTTDPYGYKTTAYLQDRPATPNIRDVLIDHHNAWSQHGGDLLTYLTSVADFRWGFTPSVNNLTTAKLNAIVDLGAAQRSAINVGQPVGPSPLDGASYILSDAGTLHAYGSLPTGTLGLSSTGTKWASYVFRADSALTGSAVTLSYTGTGTPLVYLDGVLLSSTDGGTTWSVGSVAAGLHGVIVRANLGSYTLNSVAMSGTAWAPAPGAHVPAGLWLRIHP